MTPPPENYKGKQLKPGIYMGSKRTEATDHIRHQFIVMVPHDPSRFKGRMANLGGGNKGIVVSANTGVFGFLTGIGGKLRYRRNLGGDVKIVRSALSTRLEPRKGVVLYRAKNPGLDTDDTIEKVLTLGKAFRKRSRKHPIKYPGLLRNMSGGWANSNTFVQTISDLAGIKNRQIDHPEWEAGAYIRLPEQAFGINVDEEAEKEKKGVGRFFKWASQDFFMDGYLKEARRITHPWYDIKTPGLTGRDRIAQLQKQLPYEKAEAQLHANLAAGGYSKAVRDGSGSYYLLRAGGSEDDIKSWDYWDHYERGKIYPLAARTFSPEEAAEVMGAVHYAASDPSQGTTLLKKAGDNRRLELPWRERVEVVIVKGDKVLLQKRDGYVEMPGGGIDPGETMTQACKREAREEAGARLKNLRPVGIVEARWYPGIKDTDWGMELWEKYRGSRTHFYLADLDGSLETPTSREGDRWYGKKWIPITEALEFMYSLPNSYGMKEYRDKQKSVIIKALMEQLKGKEATEQRALLPHDSTESFFRGPTGEGPVLPGVTPRKNGEVVLDEDLYVELADLSPVLLYEDEGQEADHTQTWRQVGEISVTHKGSESDPAAEDLEKYLNANSMEVMEGIAQSSETDYKQKIGSARKLRTISEQELRELAKEAQSAHDYNLGLINPMQAAEDVMDEADDRHKAESAKKKKKTYSVLSQESP